LEKEKWSNLFDQLEDQYDELIDNIKNDPATVEFGENVKKFAHDLVFNKRGEVDLGVMQSSLSQMKNLVVDMVKKQLAEMSLASLEFSNDTYDVKIEDMGFSGNILPEYVDFVLKHDTHLNTNDSSKDLFRQTLYFRVDHIKPEFRNFKFWYSRKSFPKIDDYGMADIKITGSGLAIYITWKLESRGGERPVATLQDVKVHIDGLEININDEATKHNILDRFLAPYAASNIKDKLGSALENLLRENLLEMNSRVNNFFESKPIDNLRERTTQQIEVGFK